MNVPGSPDEVWSDEVWLDEEAGPVVRHYAMTSGRTRPTRGEFDLITLIHSLEHFPDPGALLRTLAGKLTANGLLLVQVCNTERNPYPNGDGNTQQYTNHYGYEYAAPNTHAKTITDARRAAVCRPGFAVGRAFINSFINLTRKKTGFSATHAVRIKRDHKGSSSYCEKKYDMRESMLLSR